MDTIVTAPPKSKQAADIIRAEIAALGLTPGTRLLTARQFAARLAVSKHVVQNAFAVLEKEGLLETHVGRGTFISSRPVKHPVAMVCDLIYFRNGERRFVDKVVEALGINALKYDLAPHFLTGRGADAREFAASLSMDSSVWREIRGVVAMAWKDGLAEILASRGIPLVTISSTHLVPNSVIFDYDSLGRMAAQRFIATSAEDIYLVGSQDFMTFGPNNPVRAFLDEWKLQGRDPARIKVISAEPRLECGIEVGREIGARARQLFFTDENVCAGYNAWQEREGQANTAGHVVTQTCYEMASSLPAAYDKLAFVIGDVCEEAVLMLRRLSAAASPEPEQRFIAPVLLPGKCDAKRITVKN